MTDVTRKRAIGYSDTLSLKSRTPDCRMTPLNQKGIADIPMILKELKIQFLEINVPPIPFGTSQTRGYTNDFAHSIRTIRT